MPLAQAMTEATRFHQQGNLAGAEPIYRSVLARHADLFDALHLLGVLCFQTGRLPESLQWLNKALEQNARSADAFYNRGLVLRALGRLSESLESFDAALGLKPDYLAAQFSRADCLKALGRNDEALSTYDRILSLKPDHTNAHNDRGNVLSRLGRLDEALSSYDEALKHGPENAAIYFNRGNVLAGLDRLDEALSSYDDAIRLDPDHAGTFNNRGGVFRRIGERIKALEDYRKAISLDPSNAAAHRHLSLLSDYSAEHLEHADQIESLLASDEIQDPQKMHLYYALGKIYADCRQTDKAFGNYHKANDIRARECPFERASHKHLVDRLIAIYTDDLFQRFAGFGSESKIPVLIVGMPRSGTTLVEQILSSHPEVGAGGELRAMAEMEKSVVSRVDSSAPYPDNVLLLREEHFSAYADDYLQCLKAVSADAKRVSDKMPRNFLSLGLFKILFPEGSVIHCRRHPLDTCLSIYFNYFPERNHYSFKLESLGHYYNDYQRIMAHWRASSHVEYHEVEYENLIVNQEEVSRDLIEHVGLDWDSRCLEFHKNKRPVDTASSDQVRRPIYSTSVDRWKDYEEHLQPLIAVLEHQNS